MQTLRYITVIFALIGAFVNGLNLRVFADVTRNGLMRKLEERITSQIPHTEMKNISSNERSSKNSTLPSLAECPRNKCYKTKLTSEAESPKKKPSNSRVNTFGSKVENIVQRFNVSGNETFLKMVRYDKGDTIRLRCRIPTGPYLVMWNKIGLEYPLTIGTTRFIPDDRFQARFKPPDKWRLTILNATETDSGVYRCETSLQDSSHPTPEPKSHKRSEKKLKKLEEVEENRNTKENKTKNNDYYVTVVEPKPTDRFQVDAPASEPKPKRNKTIVITGPKIVFYGSSLELVCRATFPTDEAKLNPQITLEWYHRGVRRRPSLSRSGGVYITERWLDSHLLESRLLVAWVSEADAGQWICLDRSNMHPKRDGFLLTAQQTRKQHTGLSGEINLTPMHSLPQPIPVEDTSDHGIDNQLAFDRIEVEIIDLPDPTHFPPPYLLNRGTTPRVPTFAIMGPVAIGPGHASLRAARAGTSAFRSPASMHTSKHPRNAAFNSPVHMMPLQMSAVVFLLLNLV